MHRQTYRWTRQTSKPTDGQPAMIEHVMCIVFMYVCWCFHVCVCVVQFAFSNITNIQCGKYKWSICVVSCDQYLCALLQIQLILCRSVCTGNDVLIIMVFYVSVCWWPTSPKWTDHNLQISRTCEWILCLFVGFFLSFFLLSNSLRTQSWDNSYG